MQEHIEKGVVIAGHGAKLETVLKLFNDSSSPVVGRGFNLSGPTISARIGCWKKSNHKQNVPKVF